MVLGLRSKHKKGASVQVEYVVQVDEIKPWPPSQSLKSVQSVLLQWENNGQSSGSIVSSVGDGSIEFREPFTLPLTLCREKKAHDKFQKNFLDFYLYELRKDKTTKGQLLGTSVINLADFGLIEEVVSIYTPLNCKKSSKKSEQPALFVNIHPTERGSSSSSQVSAIEKDGQESVADSVNGKNEDDDEIASFTDDESPHSSRQGKIAHESITENVLRDEPESDLLFGLDSAAVLMDSTSRSSRNVAPGLSGSLSLNGENSGSNTTSLSKFSVRSMTSIQKKSASQVTGSSSSLQIFGNKNGKATDIEQQSLMYDVQEDTADRKGLPKDSIKLSVENGRGHRFTSNTSYLDSSFEDNSDPALSYNDHRQDSRESPAESSILKDLHVGVVNGKGMELLEIDQDEDYLKKIPHFSEIKLGRKQKGDTLNSNKVQGSSITNGKSKHVKSHDLANRSGLPDKAAKLHVSEDARSNGKGNKPMNGSPDRKNEWKYRIEILEEELREAAAVEVSLYSVVAEHGGSAHKVHAPARRLSRFYAHACTAKSRAKQAGAARAAVSGLVLVSKACGNDVPRLTFWLSNSVMLRAIVSQAAGGRREYDRPYAESNTGKTSLNGRSLKKRNEVSFNKDHNSLTEGLGEWEDIETFMLALEQVEAWIFSRIVESVWWQTLTPHMQNTATNSGGRSMSSSIKKTYGRRSSLGDQEQGNFSIELWKKAFKDACERLCPVRAGGHECGCLPLLARLVMEQLVSRLDVAMFNAILRESAEEMPTDPVSDPICDSKVLPIPAGKSSFGAGAQLKNAIGDWSRWLSTLFGIEENDSSGDNEDLLHDKAPGPAKPFHLLNALSSLMMLPFEMLADPQTRKEVCPILGPTLIRRVLNGFVPDEFCPIPVPPEVLTTLDSEDDVDTPEESVSTVPYTASPTLYLPPSVRSIKTFLGENGKGSLQRSGSSVLKKSYTSDDELDELDSPLTSIVADRFRGSPNLAKINLIAKGKGDRKVARYQLLRQVWRAEEH
ncbi:uncharacterized protein LOC132641261 [Lycium barbarum]|uniref:uncharacterized protein LOC132641261 n=1 Tax=Lycium barbarum TaxID=112863 RepID=UPI00293F6E19|nr:uncharacterized protein LOC132641261 [Lycium barbarum]XP_060214167.1 uncharacterized protein LOC132641261 [Lycium barbarum]XP_060214168.1 uncharacterized protein LOC132641261 [Lycium barbarum]